MHEAKEFSPPACIPKTPKCNNLVRMMTRHNNLAKENIFVWRKTCVNFVDHRMIKDVVAFLFSIKLECLSCCLGNKSQSAPTHIQQKTAFRHSYSCNIGCHIMIRCCSHTWLFLFYRMYSNCRFVASGWPMRSSEKGIMLRGKMLSVLWYQV